MQIRFLGAHQLETKDAHLTGLLVDGRLAIDAGSLGRSLSLDEQRGIEAIALTHAHYDHVRDLPTLGLATFDDGRTIDLFGLEETLDAVQSRLMDGLLYPDFTVRPTPEAPKYRLWPVLPFHLFPAAGCMLQALPVPHNRPTVAYLVVDGDERSFLFGGDCGPGVRQIWPHVRPDAMALECSYPNRLGEGLANHLTPATFAAELQAYREVHGSLPQLVATHLNPVHEQEIRKELAQVERELGHPITVAHEGLCIEL